MKLQPLLIDYLLEHNKLPLPDAGQLSIEYSPAVLVVEKDMLTAQSANIIFSKEKYSEAESQKLISFISNRLDVSADEATVLLENEGNLQTAFADNDNFSWEAIGNFQKQPDGTIAFSQDETINGYLPAIPLVAAKATTTPSPQIEIKEEETPAPVYAEFEEPVKKDNWWVWAIVIFLVSVALICIYYFL